MKKEIIIALHSKFEQIVQTEPETGVEFWFARDLQEILDYSKWDNFLRVIEKAKEACEKSGYITKNHFLNVEKIITIGSGAERTISDIILSRYACYLIAQNGDPAKDPIAFAQTYFAVQTRKQEIIEKRLAEVERLMARKKLSQSEKELSSLIFERLKNNQSFALIRNQGDKALFGGFSTKKMKSRLGVPANRSLADFLPTITIKAKDFANEITNFNIKRDDLKTEPDISAEHVKNNTDVRNLLTNRNIKPEELPPAEDVKKVERRVKTERKKIPKTINRSDS